MTTPGRREDPSSRRMIDLATGILMGLRGCSARDAFDDLVKAVHQTGIGPAALATALAHLVGGKGDGVPIRPRQPSSGVTCWPLGSRQPCRQRSPNDAANTDLRGHCDQRRPLSLRARVDVRPHRGAPSWSNLLLGHQHLGRD